jgi:hypothetical protein
LEEDIKLVEQRLDYYEESPEGCNWRVSFEGNEITQLRDLLTRYKQEQLTDKEKEVVEAYRNLIKYTGSNSWVICDPKQMWSNYFIPKSKVKEKIEELKGCIKFATEENWHTERTKGAITILQELLEREGK